MTLDPENGVAHSTRGHILEALGRRAEAIASLEEALAKKPDAYITTKAREALARLRASS